MHAHLSLILVSHKGPVTELRKERCPGTRFGFDSQGAGVLSCLV